MRGVALVVAVTVVAEVGDFRRFANARQLMAYLGLVPSEHSSGASVRRGGITKAGNVLARRVLIEGAWTYRMPARVSRKLHDRNEKLKPSRLHGIDQSRRQKQVHGVNVTDLLDQLDGRATERIDRPLDLGQAKAGRRHGGAEVGREQQ